VDLKGGALVTPGQYGGQSIDPMVFTDTDGPAYLYFGQGQLNAMRLNDDMASFSRTPVNIKPAGSSHNEGTFVFKRNGLDYFTCLRHAHADGYCRAGGALR
jgi:beta-xylosidase